MQGRHFKYQNIMHMPHCPTYREFTGWWFWP